MTNERKSSQGNVASWKLGVAGVMFGVVLAVVVSRAGGAMLSACAVSVATDRSYKLGPPLDNAMAVMDGLEFQAFAISIGVVSVFLGAFVAARIAHRQEVLHSLAVGFIVAVADQVPGIGLVMSNKRVDDPCLLLIGVDMCLMIASALLAGRLARWRRQQVSGGGSK